MNRIAVLLTACAGLATGSVQAGHAAYDGYGVGYDHANVLAVEPIIEREPPRTYRQCYRTPARYYTDETYVRDTHYPHRHSSASGAVLGAIVGGALGNTVGRGDGRRAATIAGALIGAGVGADIQRREHYREHRYYPARTVAYETERCELVSHDVGDERVVGYRVSYEYAGREYEAITDRHPGDRLRVRVEVVPD